ncbi:MAG: ATP-binding protein, partial [Bacteroidaceae bacterium]|nr:ATP-binding protein [Bacteroidaceae bacterium]
NALWGRHIVNEGKRSYDIAVGGRLHFRVLSEAPKRQLAGIHYAMNGIRRGDEHQIPLWLFGFLY